MKRIIGILAVGLCMGLGVVREAVAAGGGTSCAWIINHPVCAEETECECNESNGNCKRWIKPEVPPPGTSIFGETFEVYSTVAVCYRKYRCRNISPTGGCDDDAQCVKVVSSELLVETGFVDAWEWVYPSVNCP